MPKQDKPVRGQDKEHLPDKPSPDTVVAAGILEAGDKISAALTRQPSLEISEIPVKCSKPYEPWVEKTETGSYRRFASTTLPGDAKKAAIEEAERNAVKAVRNALRDLWNAVKCEPGCLKSLLPDPIPASIKVPGHITKEEPGTFWDYYEAEATAKGDLTITCNPVS